MYIAFSERVILSGNLKREVLERDGFILSYNRHTCYTILYPTNCFDFSTYNASYQE